MTFNTKKINKEEDEEVKEVIAKEKERIEKEDEKSKGSDEENDTMQFIENNKIKKFRNNNSREIKLKDNKNKENSNKNLKNKSNLIISKCLESLKMYAKTNTSSSQNNIFVFSSELPDKNNEKESKQNQNHMQGDEETKEKGTENFGCIE